LDIAGEGGGFGAFGDGGVAVGRIVGELGGGGGGA
jgi:hypothetical protein